MAVTVVVVAADCDSVSDIAELESIDPCILSANGLLPIGGAHGEILLVFKILPTVTSDPLELILVGIGCCKRTEFCGLIGFKPRNLIACT